MPFVSRDQAGKVNGKYANLQPGVAEEHLEDDDPELKPSSDALIAARLRQLNIDCESAIAIVSFGYPASEVLSWPKQEQEARAYQASTTSQTPLVDAIAEARGIDKDELVQRIIAKADAFAIYSGEMIGKRQKLEDQIAALGESPTPEQLEAIQWE